MSIRKVYCVIQRNSTGDKPPYLVQGHSRESALRCAGGDTAWPTLEEAEHFRHRMQVANPKCVYKIGIIAWETDDNGPD